MIVVMVRPWKAGKRCTCTCCQSAQQRSDNCPRALTAQYQRREPTLRAREPALRARFPSARVKFRRREHALRAPFPSAIVQIRRREPALPAPFASAAALIRRRGHAFQAPPPSTMAREPALHAPLPSATRHAAMRLMLRRVALLSERIHLLLSLTMWWRSV